MGCRHAELIFWYVKLLHMSKSIENLARLCDADALLDEGYRAMAADKNREIDAAAWCNGLAGGIGDMADATRCSLATRTKNVEGERSEF